MLILPRVVPFATPPRPLIEVHGLVGKPLTLIVRDEEGHVVKVESAMPLTRAEKVPITEEKLRDQLGRLGGTPFKLGELKNFLSGEVLLPVSELNRLRRDAAAELEKLRAAPKRWQIFPGSTGLRPVVSGVSPETGERDGLIEGLRSRHEAERPDKIRLDA